MIERCPFAEWVPWKYPNAQGQLTYYRNANQPIATVVHVAEGWGHTMRHWANIGFYPKSWHFTIYRNGHIMQHLRPQDGGYHAGITIQKALQYPPKWELWKGPYINVNTYTIGIENEGFHNQWPWPKAQMDANIRLNEWISKEWNIPFEQVHFPPHAKIDLRDRPFDFAFPADRVEYYEILFKDKDVVDIEARRIAGEALATAKQGLAASRDALKLAQEEHEMNRIQNDVLVITRDLARIAASRHSENWRLHKKLREEGYQTEYKGDYKPYVK